MKQVAGIGNKIIAAFIILVTIVVIFIPSVDFTDHLQDYLVHILFLMIVSGLIGLIVNNRIILYTSFACAASLALFLKNASNTELKNPEINDRDRITVVHMNLSLITDIDTVIKNIKDESVDIISFQEYTPDWANIIPKIAQNIYPYQHEVVRIDLFGKAIFSKYPIDNLEIIEYDDIPNISVDINKKKLRFNLFSTYMTPALEKQSRSTARNQFKRLEEYIKEKNEGMIVMGEFNQVYWSHDILSFRNRTGLLNSRRGVDITSFKMPYDHIFYSPSLECYYFEELNDNATNHIGCKASFQIKRESTKRKI